MEILPKEIMRKCCKDFSGGPQVLSLEGSPAFGKISVRSYLCLKL